MLLFAAGAQANGDETLRIRVEALALGPRIDAAPGADAWFLTRFHERRQFSRVRDTEAKLYALFSALDASVRHGLDSGDYHLPLLHALRMRRDGGAGEQARIDLDVLATDALARHAFHLRFGKVSPEALEPTWNFSRTLDGSSPVVVIQGLVDAPDPAGARYALAPQEERHAALMDGLATYRELRGRGGWPQVPGGETLRVGLHGPRALLLIYGTVVPERGVLHFLPDIYSRDARLLQALDEDFEFTPPAGHEDAVLSGGRAAPLPAQTMPASH